MQTLNASMDGAVTAEAGREFQSRTADGKKEPLYAFTEQNSTGPRTRYHDLLLTLQMLQDIRSSAGMSMRRLTILCIMMA